MMFITKNLPFAGISILLAGGANAFWRMPCLTQSGLARIDPLVAYGTVSEHMHAIHGSSGFSETSGWSELRAGSCTTCGVAEDKSAYWTPAVYFQDAATGKFEVVTEQGGVLAYYLLYPNANDPTNKVYGFPAGFRMIAGNSNLRNFSDYAVPDIPKSDWTGEYTTQAFLSQAALGFNCLNYAATPEGSLYRHFLPDKAFIDANCLDGVRFELMFPSCWNGANSSANFKDHVAYPSEVMTGDCPEGYPKRLVSMFFENIWRTQDYIGRDGQFILSPGDPTGYGYHGDFIMGWDEDFLQEAVDQCTNLSGQIEDCPLFTIQDQSVGGNCKIEIPSVLSGENAPTVSVLPGNPAIVSGPAPAHGAIAGGNAAQSARPSSSLSFASSHIFTTSAPHASGAELGIVQSQSSTATPSIVTPAPAPVPADAKQVPISFFSTERSTAPGGHTVYENLWVEEDITVTLPQETVTVSAAAGRKRHLHKHQGIGI